MREFERIDRITNLINAIWKHEQYQDARFHQLISSLESEFNKQNRNIYSNEVYKREDYENEVIAFQRTTHTDLFYVEDDKTEKFLIAYLDSLK